MVNSLSRYGVRGLLAIAAYGFAQGAAALSASPMVVEMESIGEQSRAMLTVRNGDAQTMSVEVETLAVAVDGDGEATFTPDDESLIVFPPIASIAPGGSQVFQIQYAGDPELGASETFRLSILQVPVQLDGAEPTLAVATNIHTLVNVAPPGAIARIEVVSSEPGEVGHEWIVTLRNDGNRHARLQETLWQISTPAKNIMLSRADISRHISGSLVPPNSTRTVKLTPPEGIDLADAKITVVVPD